MTHINAAEPRAIDRLLSYTHKITDEITKERLVKVAFVASTVALTSLCLYAPVLFTVGSVGMSIANAIQFSTAVREWDSSQHEKVRIWMITACLVTASALVSTAFLAAPLARGALTAIKILDLKTTLFKCAMLTGLLGCVLPVAQNQYKRAMELFQQGNWLEMQAHMDKNPEVRGQIRGFFEKLAFYSVLASPTLIETLPLSHSTETLLLPFLSTEEKVRQLKVHLEDLHYNQQFLEQEEWEEIWATVITYLEAFPEDVQVKLLPDIVRAAGVDLQNIRDQLPPNLVLKLFSLATNIQQRYPEILEESRAKCAAIQTQIDAINDPKNQAAQVKAVSQALTSLRQEIMDYCTQAALYCPSLVLTPLKELQSSLLTGPIASTIERLNALEVQEVEENIDENDATWNYFLIHFGQDSYNQLRGVFAANTLDDLDAALDQHRIGTIGDFIGKVLHNDKTILKNKEACFQRLQTYLESKSEIRSRLYSYLSGGALTQGTRVATVAGKVAYRATMLFSAIAPIIAFPELVAVGAGCSFVCHVIPPVRRAIGNFLENTQFGRLLYERVDFIYTLATRRPLLSLFGGPAPQEITTYDAANLYGKLRIISWELGSGWLLMALRISSNPQEEGIGGFFLGVGVGREAAELATRAWTRIRTR